MTSLLLSRRDLDFLLYEWLDVPSLTRAERFADHSRETFDAALDTCERIATDLFAPHNQKADQNEPHFDGQTVTLIDEVKPALQAFADAGLVASGRDYAMGGMQLPTVVNMAGLSYFYAANIGTSAYPLLTVGNANLLLAHGNEAQIEAFVKPELDGRFFGTMCLSEPQAGSDSLASRTRAVLSPDGKNYILNGQKMWITNGGFADIYIVFAKIDGEKFSCFIVERGTPGFTAGAEEKKMGIKGSSTTPLFFENSPVPKENLLHEPGRGHVVAFNTLNAGRFSLGAYCLGGS